MVPMVRTQIQLTDEQAAALRHASAREGKSMAEVIRCCLDEHLRTAGVVDRAAAEQRARDAIGRFRSGLDDLAREHDRHLAAALDG